MRCAPHHYFEQLSSFYAAWHNHRLHPHTHWSVLGAFVVAVAVTFIGLGWSGYSYGVPYVAFAQSTITINAGIQHQTIEGFGAAVDVNKIDWTQADKSAMADKAVNDLGLSSIRWGGDNLFNKIEQTGNDSSGYVKENDNSDPNVADSVYFSDKIDQEFGSQIAYMKEFQNRGVNRLLISMWKPAVWFRRDDVTGQCNSTKYSEGGDLCIPEQADELGEHVSATLNTLKSKGLNVTWFSPVNEPDYQRGIPPGSNGMASVLNVFSSRFSKDGLNVSLVAPETAGIENASMWPYSSYANLVSHIDVHGYVNYGDPEGALPMYQTFRSAMQPLNKPIMQTEFSNFWGAGGDMTIQDTFQEALFTAQHIHYQLTEANINLWMWWSYMNSEFGSNVDASDPPIGRGLQCRNGPPPGVCDGLPSWQCGYYCVAPGMRLVWVRPANRGGGVFYSPKYFAMKRFSRFIPVGSKRYDVSGVPGGALVSAYGHTNGTFTVVAINTSASPKQLAMNVTGGINVSSLNKYTTSEPCELDSMNTSSSYSMSSASFNGCDQSGGTISVNGGSFTDTIPPQSIVTYSTMTDTTPLPHDPICPDGLCNGSETQASCPTDCANTGGGGGNGGGGSAPNKPQLCYCPNGSCPAQCGGTTGGGGPMCGQNGCEQGETAQSCPADCGSGPTCNNNRTCDPGETTTNCPADCPPAQVCTPNTETCPNCYTSQKCVGQCNATGTGWVDGNAGDGCPTAPTVGSYPLIGWQTFGGAVDDFYSRFDLVIKRGTSPSGAKQSIYTEDWNTGCGLGASQPEGWILHDSTGNRKEEYDSGSGPYMWNLSDFSPAVNFNGKTQTYLQACAEKMGSIDTTQFLGIATDGMWGDSEVTWFYDRSEWADIDIDQNGVNDHSEHTKDWFIQHWQAGINSMLADMRARLGPTAVIVPNSGNTHSWGWPWTNGIIIEKQNGTFFDTPDDNQYFHALKQGTLAPFTTVLDGLVQNGDPFLNTIPAITSDASRWGTPDHRTRDNLSAMRYNLALAMFNDAYFSFQDMDEGNPHAPGIGQEHYWSFWYDEFESDLGTPTGETTMLRSGLWYRCFDKGIVVANTDGSDKLVTSSDLAGACGYNGVYWRLHSGQDLALKALSSSWVAQHDGSQFSSASLDGRVVNGFLNVGDGLILLRQPQTVVSDIIIDNVYMGTSPASDWMTSSNGFTQESRETGSQPYTIYSSWVPGTYAYAWANPGTDTATFRPTVGVAGQYEIFEWHDTIPNSPTASNVSHIITHAGGQDIRTVDQTMNVGRWNSLGTYRFNTGTNGNVVISAQGANDPLVADAIKFTYKGP